VLSSVTRAVLFASKNEEDSVQYEVLEGMLKSCLPCWCSSLGTHQEIAPTRDLWGTQPSSDAAASSYAEYIRQQEDEEAYAPQIGDDVRDIRPTLFENFAEHEIRQLMHF